MFFLFETSNNRSGPGYDLPRQKGFSPVLSNFCQCSHGKQTPKKSRLSATGCTTCKATINQEVYFGDHQSFRQFEECYMCVCQCAHFSVCAYRRAEWMKRGTSRIKFSMMDKHLAKINRTPENPRREWSCPFDLPYWTDVWQSWYLFLSNSIDLFIPAQSPGLPEPTVELAEILLLSSLVRKNSFSLCCSFCRTCTITWTSCMLCTTLTTSLKPHYPLSACWAVAALTPRWSLLQPLWRDAK